jgi:hypothetical protein
MSDTVALILVIMLCSFLLGVYVGDMIWKIKIARAAKRIEEINDEIVELIHEIQVKFCTIEKLPDGTLQMFSDDGQFLAQGTDKDTLIDSLRSRFGQGQVWLSPNGTIET